MEELRVSTAAREVWLRFVGRELAGERVDFERLCAEHVELAGDLRSLRASWERTTAPERPVSPTPEPLDELTRRLATPTPRASRYRVEGEVARGGMGVVQRVWDADLGRHLALKTLSAVNVDRHVLARFVEEAQIAAQLDHPAIVPVHDIGVDVLGRPFFVMKLVDGRDLREVFAQAWKSEDGWSTTRVLGVLLKVCEAAGYAHKKGVIHRDLKPANVMVGTLGEVYVMDWGVARVMASSAGDPSRASRVTTIRSVAGAGDTDSGLLTAAGDVLGTAAYMSPEQARGEIERLTPQSDVYAVGAMLYHLLAQRAPHARDGASSAEVLMRLLAGPPPPLARLNADVAPELAAICDRAMAREPAQRYADLAELADDLRAYLEGRVVRAHRTGAWTAARKWVGRNRALSGAIATLLAVAAIVVWQGHTARVVDANIDMLARLRLPGDLLLEYDSLWPPTPESAPRMEQWLRKAESVAAYANDYRRDLDRLRMRALPWDPSAPAEQAAQREIELQRQLARRRVEYLESSVAELAQGALQTDWRGEPLEQLRGELESARRKLLQRQAASIPHSTWTFALPFDQLLHDRWTAVLPDVERLASPSAGYGMIERVRRAIGFAREVQRSTLEAHAAEWAAAIDEIRDPRRCPEYRGLVLAPQLGLIPLWRDRASGLWEFAHLGSGEPPRRTPDGRLALNEATGLVLVLLPGGQVELGAHGESDHDSNGSSLRAAHDAPRELVELEPFFIAKHETTQSQWERWTGMNPSLTTARRHALLGISGLHPVECVTWRECADVARELGLCLPTGSQWEYAARAGTRTPWSTGGEARSLCGRANVLDRAGLNFGPPLATPGDSALDCDDGWPLHAPVGSLEPNPFGLFDMHGNVAEWCADESYLNVVGLPWTGTGARGSYADYDDRIVRGGSAASTASEARSAARKPQCSTTRHGWTGVRFARALDR